jgi:hypothetical protein
MDPEKQLLRMKEKKCRRHAELQNVLSLLPYPPNERVSWCLPNPMSTANQFIEHEDKDNNTQNSSGATQQAVYIYV